MFARYGVGEWHAGYKTSMLKRYPRDLPACLVSREMNQNENVSVW